MNRLLRLPYRASLEKRFFSSWRVPVDRDAPKNSVCLQSQCSRRSLHNSAVCYARKEKAARASVVEKSDSFALDDFSDIISTAPKLTTQLSKFLTHQDNGLGYRLQQLVKKEELSLKTIMKAGVIDGKTVLNSPLTLMTMQELLAFHNAELAYRCHGLFTLFADTTFRLGSKAQARIVLEKLDNLDIFGCVAWDELKMDPTNVNSKIETTATYNPSTKCFEINTAAGNPKVAISHAKNAKFYIIFANLINPAGENKGIHAFFVEASSVVKNIQQNKTSKSYYDTSKTILGTYIPKDENMPTHFGAHGMLELKNLQVPRKNLLDQFTKLSDSGAYKCLFYKEVLVSEVQKEAAKSLDPANMAKFMPPGGWGHIGSDNNLRVVKTSPDENGQIIREKLYSEKVGLASMAMGVAKSSVDVMLNDGKTVFSQSTVEMQVGLAKLIAMATGHTGTKSNWVGMQGYPADVVPNVCGSKAVLTEFSEEMTNLALDVCTNHPGRKKLQKNLDLCELLKIYGGANKTNLVHTALRRFPIIFTRKVVQDKSEVSRGKTIGYSERKRDFISERDFLVDYQKRDLVQMFVKREQQLYGRLNDVIPEEAVTNKTIYDDSAPLISRHADLLESCGRAYIDVFYSECIAAKIANFHSKGDAFSSLQDLFEAVHTAFLCDRLLSEFNDFCNLGLVSYNDENRWSKELTQACSIIQSNHVHIREALTLYEPPVADAIFTVAEKKAVKRNTKNRTITTPQGQSGRKPSKYSSNAKKAAKSDILALQDKLKNMKLT